MGNAYDLFKHNENREPIWVETIVGLNNLKKLLMKLSALRPGKYMVYDPTEGKSIEPFKKA
jgi:hypothetical protein